MHIVSKFVKSNIVFAPAIMLRPHQEGPMQKALLFCFSLKTSAAKYYRLLVEAYEDSDLSKNTC